MDGDYFGPSDSMSPILLDEVECKGNEKSITECTHDKWMKHDCTHAEDAGVLCGSAGETSTPSTTPSTTESTTESTTSQTTPPATTIKQPTSNSDTNKGKCAVLFNKIWVNRK